MKWGNVITTLFIFQSCQIWWIHLLRCTAFEVHGSDWPVHVLHQSWHLSGFDGIRKISLGRRDGFFHIVSASKIRGDGRRERATCSVRIACIYRCTFIDCSFSDIACMFLFVGFLVLFALEKIIHLFCSFKVTAFDENVVAPQSDNGWGSFPDIINILDFLPARISASGIFGVSRVASGRSSSMNISSASFCMSWQPLVETITGSMISWRERVGADACCLSGAAVKYFWAFLLSYVWFRHR